MNTHWFAWCIVRLLLVLASPAVLTITAQAADSPRATLRVMLIPADGGTATGTLADFQPLFSAVSRSTGLKFDLRVGESYAAVIQAMESRLVDVAWLGPVAYVQAHDAGAAEMLGIAIRNGESVYYSGLFVRADSPLRSLRDLIGKRVAFGDINSGSSFTYPIDLLLRAGIDPARDLAEIHLVGSHSASLAALIEGHVDAAALSFESFTKAASGRVIDPSAYRVLGRSEPIPNPPLALSTALAPELKRRLREAFADVHRAPGINAEMIRGYGGGRVDRYDTHVPEATFATVSATYARVSDEVRAAVLRKASDR
jgi:phosphonate transport system substrate-binding protein